MSNSPSDPAFFLPIYDADVILEGCQSLLLSLITRIIEKHVNHGRVNYTDEPGIRRVKVNKIVIEFHN